MRSMMQPEQSKRNNTISIHQKSDTLEFPMSWNRVISIVIAISSHCVQRFSKYIKELRTIRNREQRIRFQPIRNCVFHNTWFLIGWKILIFCSLFLLLCEAPKRFILAWQKTKFWNFLILYFVKAHFSNSIFFSQ